MKEKFVFIYRPDLKKFWNTSKNHLKFEDVTIGQRIEVYWKCKNNHVFKSELKKMCSRKKFKCNLCKYNLSLGKLHPELIDFFDEKKNGFSIFHVSGKKNYPLWWKCPNGCSLKTKPSNHKSGFMCYFCNPHKRKTLSEAYPYILKYWDAKKNNKQPEEISSWARGNFHWKCDKLHEWIRPIYNQAKFDNTCPFCKNNRKTISDVEEELSVSFDIERNLITKFETYAYSQQCAWWKCPNGHFFKRSIRNQVRKNTVCLECFKNESSLEKEIKDYLKTLNKNFKENLSFLNNGAGIDVFYPELNRAIEINGEYWHSDKFAISNGWKNSKEKHLSKLKECNELGITLIYIWEDDWNYNKDEMKLALKDFVIDGKINKSFVRLTSNRDL